MAMPTRPGEMISRRIVLLVDDDSRVRESLTDLLSSAGIEASTFASGEALLCSDALATARCLITDIRMPGMDGWEVQARVKHSHPQLPVIFISAFQDALLIDHALALGTFAFLSKPFDGEELLHTVKAALSLSAGL